MKRRHFILLTSGTLVFSSVYLYSHYSSEDVLKPGLESYIKSLKGLDAIGHFYKQQNPDLDFQKQLELKLLPFTNDTNIVNKISKSIGFDFSVDKTVEVDGWILSETECLIAAVFVSYEGYIKTNTVVRKQDFTNARSEKFLTIKNWGPQKTLKNSVFNKQSDGHAGMWFIVDNPPPNLTVFIDGKSEITFSSEKSITSGIHDLQVLKDFLNQVGEHEVAIYDKINHRKQIVGYFSVLPIPKKLIYADGTVSKVFCPIEKWGPKIAHQNQAFNVQPNGNAAVWIKTKCAPRTSKVLINGVEIRTSIQAGIVTASSPFSDLKQDQGQYHIELFDKKTKEKLSIGKIVIKTKLNQNNKE